MRNIVLHQLGDIEIEPNMYYNDMSLFNSEWSKSQLFEYVDANYLLDPKNRSQTGMYSPMVVWQYHGD